MKNIKFVGWSILFIVLLLGLFNPSVFADSKKELARLVMEHEIRIEALEQLLKNPSDSKPESEPLSPEVKEALLKEVGIKIESLSVNWNGDQITVTDFQINQIKNNHVLQIFTEGTNDWTDTPDSYGDFGIGRHFASNLIYSFDSIGKLYGVDLKYEFYENGERITVFTDLN